jgi:hypothetical protein
LALGKASIAAQISGWRSNAGEAGVITSVRAVRAKRAISFFLITRSSFDFTAQDLEART